MKYTQPGLPMERMVTISVASMRQRFNGCDPEYIASTCHGACCRSSSGGISVAVAPIEVKALVARGAVIDPDGFMAPDPATHRCPFQSITTHLCGLHETPDKPFGCIASPFILTTRDTLVVRNRYRLLKCYDDGRRLPAYVAFRASLDMLFGPVVARDIVGRLEANVAVNFDVPMAPDRYAMVRTVEEIRR
jgi:hypothetical protein